MQANNEARSAAACPVSLFCAAGLAVAIVLYGLAVWSPGTMFSFARSEVFVQAGTLASVANALSLIALGIRGAIAALPRASSRKHTTACASVPFAALLIACALTWCASFALENTQADAWFTLALLVASCLSGICLADKEDSDGCLHMLLPRISSFCILLFGAFLRQILRYGTRMGRGESRPAGNVSFGRVMPRKLSPIPFRSASGSRPRRSAIWA